MDRISVIVPAHNAGRFLVEALDSVFEQGLDDPEVVVVDDGSSDDTAEVARRYGHGVRVLSQPQSGSGRARNVGLAATTGGLVAFLDADDIWVEEKSSLQLPVLENDPGLGLVFSDMVSFRDGNGPSRPGASREGPTYFAQRGFDGACAVSSIFLCDMISTPTVILRRSCLRATGTFDESLRIGQDTDLWFRLALAFPFAVVNRPLVRRRFHGSNTTSNHRLLARAVVEIWGRYLETCIEREPHMRRRLIADYARKKWNHLFQEGCSLLREGQSREARRHLASAIGVSPFSPRSYFFYVASLVGARRGAAAGPGRTG